MGKSFQPDFAALLALLRQDPSAPVLLPAMAVGLFGQTPLSLRLLSWLAYGLGVVMVAQAAALAPHRRDNSMVLAALLALCSPYPVRDLPLRPRATPCGCCWWPWVGGGDAVAGSPDMALR